MTDDEERRLLENSVIHQANPKGMNEQFSHQDAYEQMVERSILASTPKKATRFLFPAFGIDGPTVVNLLSVGYADDRSGNGELVENDGVRIIIGLVSHDTIDVICSKETAESFFAALVEI